MTNRWVYRGSLTTPPCTETIYWNVLQKVYPIKPRHLEAFKRLIEAESYAAPSYIYKEEGNYRLAQPIIDQNPVRMINDRVADTSSDGDAMSDGAAPAGDAVSDEAAPARDDEKYAEEGASSGSSGAMNFEPCISDFDAFADKNCETMSSDNKMDKGYWLDVYNRAQVECVWVPE